MKTIPHLEIHLTHACNLSCESCSHYSNQGHKGILSLAEAEHSMKQWAQRLVPHTFSLLGGEPSIHPDLPEFVLLARRVWPSAHLRLVTNGFFLHRHPALPAILQRDPNTRIYLSIHHDRPEYAEKLRPVMELLKSWVRTYRIRVNIYLSFKHWTRVYRGSGNTMEPFKDGQPRQSWVCCRWYKKFCYGVQLCYISKQINCNLQNIYKKSVQWSIILRFQKSLRVA